MDTNVHNYSVQELIELIELPQKGYYTLDEIDQHISKCIKQINETADTPQSKQILVAFLIQSFEKICTSKSILYGLEQLQTLKSLANTVAPTLPSNTIVTEGSHSVIQHESTKSNSNFNLPLQKGVINPFLKQAVSILLNINTRFRPNYNSTKSTDFVFHLPNPFKNVVAMKLLSAEVPNCVYNISSETNTNEFTVQTIDLSGGIKENQNEVVIKVRDGQYTGEQLADYLNKYVFTEDNSLNRIACEMHPVSCKFRFFYDSRDISNGGAEPFDENNQLQFNIDFRLHENKKRPLQLNMGWILGYKQPYYSWDANYVLQNMASFNRFEGYNPESTFDTQGTRYFLLGVDDYNNNYVNTLVSPYQEGIMKNDGLLAKIPNDTNASDIILNYGVNNNKTREYFGPVNIDRLHIQLLNEFGNPVDLNNRDYSISLEISMLYDL